jgi:hypothetical protein
MADTSNTSAKEDSSGDTSADAGAGAGPGAGAAGAGAASAGATASFSDFSSKDMVSGSKDFLESNSWVAKLAFLLMVVIGFVILFRLMISFITWIFSPSGKVVLVNGLQNGAVSTTISQDPNNKASITILRSENEKDGIEFTWSVWLYLNGFQGSDSDSNGTYHHVFNKGNTTTSQSTGSFPGTTTPNNAPGLYINPNYDGFRVILNSFSNPYQEVIEVTDLPMAKWINVVIRVQSKNCDIYVNGRLVKRRIMTDVVKQNYDDVHVSLNGGFSGYLSNLTYFNRSISITQIQDIISVGPNLKPVSKALDLTNSKPRYLSNRWYFDQTSA